MEIKRGDVPSHTVARFTIHTMNIWRPMIPALWIIHSPSILTCHSLRVGINELRTTSLNGLGTLTRPRQDTWVFTWIQLGFKMCKTSRFRKIQQDRDTLICLATVSIHFRHYPKNYKTLHPCLQHLQDCYFSNHSSIDVCLDSSREEIALCSTAPHSGQCVQVGGPADHTTEGAQQPGSHSCVPWKGSLGSLMDFILLVPWWVPYFKHHWSLFWIFMPWRKIWSYSSRWSKIFRYIPLNLIWFDDLTLRVSTRHFPGAGLKPRTLVKLEFHFCQGGTLAWTESDCGTDITICSWYRGQSLQCLFITFELRVDRDKARHTMPQDIVRYLRYLRAEIRLQATACSSRTSSSLGSRDKPKIWVLGSQKVAESYAGKTWIQNISKMYHNVEPDLNLAPWQVFLLSHLSYLSYLSLCSVKRSWKIWLRQVSNPSLLWTSHYQSLSIWVRRTQVQIGWRVYMIDGDIMDSPHPGGMESSGDLGRSRKVSSEVSASASGLATTPGCSVAVEDNCSMISQIPTQLEMLDVSHCYMLLHILPVETVETDTSDYCQLCRGPSLSSFSPTTGAHLW